MLVSEWRKENIHTKYLDTQKFCRDVQKTLTNLRGTLKQFTKLNHFRSGFHYVSLSDLVIFFAKRSTISLRFICHDGKKSCVHSCVHARMPPLRP